MVKALFDTNILIDFLYAVPQARKELDRFEDKAISVVTWMEVMVGASASADAGTRGFLASFVLIELDEGVADRAVALRREHRIKLPDAIVWASAQTQSRLLVTRNTKDFPASNPGIRHPYTL
jgi:predicted nucleic acid-binding protein